MTGGIGGHGELNELEKTLEANVASNREDEIRYRGNDCRNTLSGFQRNML